MVRFLHTSDWQLGMTRHYFGDGVPERFTHDRFEAVVRIGELARGHGAEFVVVAGDVFETNQVDRKTITRAIDALAQVPVPVYLLPGNHDPLDAGSVFRQATFAKRKPAHVHVLETSEPVPVRAGVELVGAPWTSKRPLEDLVQRALRDLAPALDVLRIVVAHGAVDTLSPNKNDPALIELAAAESALREGRAHYIALGDRHSLTDVGATGRLRYSGAPEPTDFDEVQPGFALLVDVDATKVSTEALPVGRWKFLRQRVRLDHDEDLDALARELAADPDRQRTALKLDLIGALTLAQKARLDELLAQQRERFAALIEESTQRELVVMPADGDFEDLGLSGFAASAVERLRALAAGADDDSATARDALALLLRLAGRSA